MAWFSGVFCYRVELPHGSEECNFDARACPPYTVVERCPDCFVSYPNLIGNGDCYDALPYNPYECGFDGGDCHPLEYAPLSSSLEKYAPLSSSLELTQPLA
eukprot:1911_1